MTAVTGRRAFLRVLLARAGSALLLLPAAACDVREFARRHGGKLRLSLATGPVGGVYYVYGAAIARLIARHVPNVEATAEVTSASADNLKLIARGRADLAIVLGPTLDEAYRGTGAFAAIGRVPVRTLATLYVNLMHVVTLAGSGIRSLGDLRGRVVSVGPPGSGTEGIAVEMLQVVGIDPAHGIRRHGLAPAVAADALKDGKIDAFFWSSGAPQAAILDVATGSRHRLRLVPNAEVVPELQRRRGVALYFTADIPGAVYPGIREPVPVVGAANLLVADAALSESLAYDILRALFDHKRELEAVHPAAKELSLATAVAGAAAPFHPGAIRVYRERGTWRQ
ncbi:MAG: TAXI family TRAP transporter solute-binding subunit [Gemmatimonadaceae bacterium]